MENVKSITVWYNDQKGNPNWPFFTGKVTYLDGTVEVVQLWTKVSQRGQTYYSGRIKPIEPAEPTQPTPAEPVKHEPQPVDFSQPASGRYGPSRAEIEKDNDKLQNGIKNFQKLAAIDFLKRFEETPVDMLRPEDYSKYNEIRKLVNSGHFDNQNQGQGANFEQPPY